MGEESLDFKKDLIENQIVMFIIPAENYWEKVILVLKNIVEVVEKIVYVTLNKPYEALLKDIKMSGLPEKKFVFVDALTQPAIGEIDEKNPNFVYVSDPRSLTDISIYSFENLGKTGANVLLIDSISHMLAYNPEHAILKFISFVTSKIKVTRHSLILVARKEDVSKAIFTDIKMFCDKIIEL